MKQATKWILSDLWEIGKAALIAVAALALLYVWTMAVWRNGYDRCRREFVCAQIEKSED